MAVRFCHGIDARSLQTGERHAFDGERRRGDAELSVDVVGRRDRHEHLLEVRRDRDLGYGKGQLAILDPEA
ncbi:hypothetical protein D3C78_1563270 [compost metagenome]